MAVLNIHGCRGSSATNGSNFERYGRDTSCYSVESEAGFLIIDAGTGINEFATQYAALGSNKPVAILFTHYHFDHIFGLPVFKLLYDKQRSLDFYGPELEGGNIQVLKEFVRPPFWPLDLERVPADIELKAVPSPGETFKIFDMTISSVALCHPQGSRGYRIEVADGSLACIFDHEVGDEAIDASVSDLVQGVDILVHDAHWVEGELPEAQGMGHSSWGQALTVASDADVSVCVLTHHHPQRVDADLDCISREATEKFSGAVVAAAGMTIELA